MKLSLIVCAITIFLSQPVLAEYRYVECRCSVDFETPNGEIINVSDYVYCPTSEVYDFTCTGNVIAWSLDTICESTSGGISKSPNGSAPANSKEVLGSLSCGI